MRALHEKPCARVHVASCWAVSPCFRACVCVTHTQGNHHFERCTLLAFISLAYTMTIFPKQRARSANSACSAHSGHRVSTASAEQRVQRDDHVLHRAEYRDDCRRGELDGADLRHDGRHARHSPTDALGRPRMDGLGRFRSQRSAPAGSSVRVRVCVCVYTCACVRARLCMCAGVRARGGR